MSKELLDYQLEVLSAEQESINEIVGRIDNITQTTKNWAVTLWAGSLGFAITDPELRKYALLTAILPLIFWFIDAWWRRLQKRSIYRLQQISDFLNGDDLVKSFEKRRVIGFTLLDPAGRTHTKEANYRKRVSISRTLWYLEVAGFYLPLVLISIFVGMLFIVGIL